MDLVEASEQLGISNGLDVEDLRRMDRVIERAHQGFVLIKISCLRADTKASILAIIEKAFPSHLRYPSHAYQEFSEFLSVHDEHNQGWIIDVDDCVSQGDDEALRQMNFMIDTLHHVHEPFFFIVSTSDARLRMRDAMERMHLFVFDEDPIVL